MVLVPWILYVLDLSWSAWSWKTATQLNEDPILRHVQQLWRFVSKEAKRSDGAERTPFTFLTGTTTSMDPSSSAALKLEIARLSGRSKPFIRFVCYPYSAIQVQYKDARPKMQEFALIHLLTLAQEAMCTWIQIINSPARLPLSLLQPSRLIFRHRHQLEHMTSLSVVSPSSHQEDHSFVRIVSPPHKFTIEEKTFFGCVIHITVALQCPTPFLPRSPPARLRHSQDPLFQFEDIPNLPVADLATAIWLWLTIEDLTSPCRRSIFSWICLCSPTGSDLAG